jgi:DNA ligase-associated metallophosphoesterase
MTECEVAGERLVLLAERAAYWPARRTLFVADFHLGKAASFRSGGIPLPPGTTSENVERLDRAIERTGAGHVVFLGDFLHSAAARAPRTLARFGEWRTNRARVGITMVRGNHDARAGDPPPEWAMRAIDAGESLGPFVLNHEPGPSARGYALAGHIHPAVWLTGCGDPGLRLPCFWFARRHGILPAFGAFTGSAVVKPRAGDQVFVIAEDEVVKVA